LNDARFEAEASFAPKLGCFAFWIRAEFLLNGSVAAAAAIWRNHFTAKLQRAIAECCVTANRREARTVE